MGLRVRIAPSVFSFQTISFASYPSAALSVFSILFHHGFKNVFAILSWRWWPRRERNVSQNLSRTGPNLPRTVLNSSVNAPCNFWDEYSSKLMNLVSCHQLLSVGMLITSSKEIRRAEMALLNSTSFAPLRPTTVEFLQQLQRTGVVEGLLPKDEATKLNRTEIK